MIDIANQYPMRKLLMTHNFQRMCSDVLITAFLSRYVTTIEKIAFQQIKPQPTARFYIVYTDPTSLTAESVLFGFPLLRS
jgi:hypothetical protein